jgi:hypothetical protein
MPPVKNVAFLKLPGRARQDVRPSAGRVLMEERHDVLKLIAETDRASCLVEPGASENPG